MDGSFLFKFLILMENADLYMFLAQLIGNTVDKALVER